MKYDYYAYYGLYDHEPSDHFRADAGWFERWNPRTRRWVRVPGGGQDFISRAVENGDGAVLMNAEERSVALARFGEHFFEPVEEAER